MSSTLLAEIAVMFLTVLLLFVECKMHYWWLKTWLDLKLENWLTVRFRGSKYSDVARLVRFATYGDHSLCKNLRGIVHSTLLQRTFSSMHVRKRRIVIQGVDLWTDRLQGLLRLQNFVRSLKKALKAEAGIAAAQAISSAAAGVLPPRRSFQFREKLNLGFPDKRLLVIFILSLRVRGLLNGP